MFKDILVEFMEFILDSNPKTDEDLLSIYNEGLEKGIEDFELMTLYIRNFPFEKFKETWRYAEDYIREEGYDVD